MRPTSILIVERDRQLRNGLVEIFRRYGFQAWGCSRERLVHRFLKHFRPDYLIADISMSDRSQMPALLSRWKMSSPATHVILEYSFHDSDLRHTALSAGAFALIVKPFLVEPFLRMIRQQGRPVWPGPLTEGSTA